MVCSIEAKYINRFLKSVYDLYRLPAYSKFDILTEMADFLDQVLDDKSRVYSRHEKMLLPVIRHLPQALKLAGSKTTELADSINQIAPFLNWQQTCGYDVLGDYYTQNYGYCSIIGPNLLIEHSRLKLGFGIWGPGLHYPLHRHAAEECYHVIGSQVQFRRQDEQWRSFDDGEAIYNKPFEIHELKSSSKAMFLLYTWRGDVAQNAELI